MRNKSLVLTGFMGSGKSTIGEALSVKFGVKCVDTDALIVEKTGRTINDIFEKDGEEYFRNLETDCVRELSASDSCMIVSCGGGLVMRDINVGYLKAIGKIVYLRAGIDTLEERLKQDDTRPLLKGEDLRGKITELMNKRSSRYEEVADIIIDTDGLDVDGVCEELTRRNNES